MWATDTHADAHFHGVDGCCCCLLLLQLDAQQTYKQALAFWATGNVTYAENAMRITHAWASNNQVQATASAATAKVQMHLKCSRPSQ
jgi:hypothetical protein